MKRCFHQKAVVRNSVPGEIVLVLIPIPGSALTVQFSGQYMLCHGVVDFQNQFISSLFQKDEGGKGENCFCF